MTLCKYSSSRITEQEKENVLKDPGFQKKSKIIKIMSEVFDKKKQASIKKQNSQVKEQKQNQNENIDKPLIKKVFEDSNLTNLQFSRIKIFEYSSSTLATMGVLLSAISFELETNQSHENISKPILWVIFISCILNALTTVVRYQSILDYQKSRKEVSQRSTLLNTGQIYHLILEFILVIIHPSPFLIGQKFTFVNSWAGPITQQQVHYFYNEILSLLGICKLFIVVRTLLLSTKWFSNSSNRVCNMYGKKPNVLFVFKALMQSNPYLCLFFVYSITLIFFGFALKISEAPLYRTGQVGFKSYANSFWTIIVTMTTIGYGDFYPYTILGRIIIFIVCLIGSLITSLMIVSLTQTLETTNYENRAICVLDKLEARERKRKFAAQCITQKIIVGLKNNQRKKKQDY
ncbi:hypothetical protein PPERSA_05669 [Pseudocohnilembus persalinus]|uniref:Potassium channel domain-containing protein n=1 Tax=Pseudocohnilembus persalinus TaxID=266149 RepID=A0A0V0QLW6_PSEPJ|nr:hypothetical protein PPERSA_05669 [Pseudocohnilembus persalinus]|eukprot:KRX03311.1 hypothetical protein PPERSA_05669 [Pseudocohnilembus persalinus]